MRVKSIKPFTPQFIYEGFFGPSVPTIPASTSLKVKLAIESDIIILNVVTKISGEYENNKFVYQIEERIELDLEGEKPEVQIILNEIVESGTRAYDKGYNDCILSSLPFPFSKICPEFDTERVRQQIEQDIE